METQSQTFSERLKNKLLSRKLWVTLLSGLGILIIVLVGPIVGTSDKAMELGVDGIVWVLGLYSTGNVAAGRLVHKYQGSGPVVKEESA